MAPKDQEKILRDAACDSEKLKIFSRGFRDDDPTVTHWIVDRKNDCYLLAKPSSVRRDEGDLRRCFFFKGCIYELSQLQYFGPEIAIIDLPPEAQLEEFKQEVCAAYMATGSDGAFMPVFTAWKGE